MKRMVKNLFLTTRIFLPVCTNILSSHSFGGSGNNQTHGILWTMMLLMPYSKYGTSFTQIFPIKSNNGGTLFSQLHIPVNHFSMLGYSQNLQAMQYVGNTWHAAFGSTVIEIINNAYKSSTSDFSIDENHKEFAQEQLDTLKFMYGETGEKVCTGL